MTFGAVLLVLVYFGILLACTKPLGLYMANVMEGRPIWILRVCAPLERALYRFCAVDAKAEMGWKHYASALVFFNALGVVAVYALQRLQGFLPFNPQQFGAVTPQSSFNTAVSFVTNTNWQGYSGESTMSYLTQMAGLAVQNFLSAATGLVVAVVLIRGFTRRAANTLGNVWVDLTRATLYILLPLALLLALMLASQGVLQNFSAYKDVTLLEPLAYEQPKTDASGNFAFDNVSTDNRLVKVLVSYTDTNGNTYTVPPEFGLWVPASGTIDINPSSTQLTDYPPSGKSPHAGGQILTTGYLPPAQSPLNRNALAIALVLGVILLAGAYWLLRRML